MLSSKQREYARLSSHRWNVKTGATRSGKTYLDIAYTIPKRIQAVKGQNGLAVLVGNTKGTLQRNIIEPMQEIFGEARVSDIRANNTATLFGQEVYCLGADSKKHVDRFRGASIKYCYGDEITTWSEDVFTMLKSRLDKPYSVFDGTCNPDNPQHWFHAFLQSDADIYQQAYTIDDNPFLDPLFVSNLKREYAGTVYYDRFIRGLWVAAEGAIYKSFVNRPQDFIIPNADDYRFIKCVVGVDFGGGTSAHSFTCTGFTRDGQIVVLKDYHEKDALTPEKLNADFIDFLRACKQRYFVTDVYCDSAEQTLINGMRSEIGKNRVGVNIGNAKKVAINERIRALCVLMGAGKFHICENCEDTIDALKSAVWNPKAITKDERLDNGTTNVDSLDSLEYTYERDIQDLVTRWQ